MPHSCDLQTVASSSLHAHRNYVKACQRCGAVHLEALLSEEAWKNRSLLSEASVVTVHLTADKQANKSETAAHSALSKQPLRLSGLKSC